MTAPPASSKACSPGHRHLAPVIVEAYKRGCYFDGWEECFKYDTWMQTFADLGIDPAFYCQRAIGLDEVTLVPHGLRRMPTNIWCGVQQGSCRPEHQPATVLCHGCGANHLLEVPALITVRNLV